MLTVTQQFTHTRHATHHTQRDPEPKPANPSAPDQAHLQLNGGQMLLERPASLRVYALIAQFVVSNLGYNVYGYDYSE